MIFTKLELFVEARLSDVLKIKGDSKIASELKSLMNKEFDFGKKLTRFLTLKKRLGNKKIQFELEYNDTTKHSLLKRVRERSSFNSVDEFNDFLKYSLNKIFPDEIGKKIFTTGRYSIYSKELDISIIFFFNIDDFSKDIYKISIITILPGKKGDKILQVK